MRIVNPSFGREAESTERAGGNSVDWAKDPIILFANSKPNAKELLEGVRDKMAAYRATDNIDYIHKDSPAQPRVSMNSASVLSGARLCMPSNCAMPACAAPRATS